MKWFYNLGPFLKQTFIVIFNCYSFKDQRREAC